jgi:hypothetical protein
MPSVLRFLLSLAIFMGLIYGGMLALVTFVEPSPREITHTIPRDKLKVFREH